MYGITVNKKIPFDDAVFFCGTGENQRHDSRLGQDFVNRFGFVQAPDIFYEPDTTRAIALIFAKYTLPPPEYGVMGYRG